MDTEPDSLQSMGLPKRQTRLSIQTTPNSTGIPTPIAGIRASVPMGFLHSLKTLSLAFSLPNS